MRTMQLGDDLTFVKSIVSKSKLERTDYVALNSWFTQVGLRVQAGQLTDADLHTLRDAFGDAMSPATLQGLVCAKPHGYLGDFEIIDKIYVRHISPNPRLARWDAYFHSQPAAKAVRNRKTYFHTLLDRHYARRLPLRVLELASGPGRSMFEWLSAHPSAKISFHCVELDSDAIVYASALNEDFAERIAFERQNVVRYRPPNQYDLIWAAGLFDYLSDKIFRSVIQRLLPSIAPGGELVIGNFSPDNGSRAYMEFGGWLLHYRSAEALASLATDCGVQSDRVRIGAESEGINLFLHISA